GKDVVAIGDMSAAHFGAAAEFAGIDDKHRCPAVGGDCLPRLRLPVHEIQQASILVDAADAENPIIGLIATKEPTRRIPDNVAVAWPERPAGHRDFNRGIAHKSSSGV